MRKYTLGCAVLLSALALGACGKKAEAPKPAETAKESEAAEETAAEEVKKGVSLKDDKKEEKAEASADSVKPVHVYMKNYGRSCYDPDSYNQKANLEDVFLLLTEEDGKAYPALKKALDKNEKERLDRAGEMLAEMVQNYDETVAYMDDPSMFYMTDEQKGYVERSDSRVVSLLKTEYIYLGGAHPDFYYIGINYDTETGKELRFKDVINDEDRFYEIATEKMSSAYGGDFDGTDIDGFRKYCAEYDADPTFTLGNEGLTVYFNEYEIGSYAQGAFLAYIPYAEYPDLFNEKYIEVPENYAIPLRDNAGFETDLDGDGMIDFVYVEEVEVENEWYRNWHIYAGDQELEVEDWCYSKEAYIVKNDGKYYLYLFESGDNDYTSLLVYDLTDLQPQDTGNFVYLSNVNGNWEEIGDGSESWNVTCTLTDPGCFNLTKHLEILGTRGGRSDYKTGKNGQPEPLADAMTLRDNSVLRARIDVEAELVDADGKVVSKTTIEEGTCLFCVRTDGIGFMDMQVVDPDNAVALDDAGEYLYTETDAEFDPNAPIYRVKVDASDYPKLVNGMEEGEVFAGIMYAG